jgi:mono/diheme cytochrome c family protein
MKRKSGLLLAIMFLVAAGLMASEQRGDWMAKVPEKDRARVNPLAQDDTAIAGGAQLFAHHCASCHGDLAEGVGRRPALRTARVRDASDGELQWLLRNGSLAHGMPAWSNLPEVQRWQLVRFLHSLP